MSDSEWTRLKASSSSKPSTESEKLFAEYLRVHRMDWCHEPNFPCSSKHPDFAIRHKGLGVLVEVKERAPIAPPNEPSHFNPHKGIGWKIEAARKKFEQLGDWQCCLAIANMGDWKTRLTPVYVYAAMLGDFGFECSIDPSGHVNVQSVRNTFLPRGGSMVRTDRDGTFKNTALSSVIILESGRVPRPEFGREEKEAFSEMERTRSRPLTGTERAECASELMRRILDRGAAICDHPVRVVVCEHPKPDFGLPCDLFNGSFDERYVFDGEAVRRVFEGKRVSELW